MSYTATTFNVMIASPGDVASERAIVRDVVYEWNAVNSGTRKIVLLPIGWESHSSPETGETAQGIINKQILSKCDLLIGVFWTRIGTETDKFSSGTVEEIEKHIAGDKPAMLYFSSQPVALDTVDPAQIEKLKEFKKSMQSRSLYESYDSHTSFKEKLYRHLQIKVNDHPLFRISEQSTTSALVDSKTSIPTLLSESRILLKEASLDPQGIIIFMRAIDGTAIQTNAKNLIPSDAHRDVAKWEQALDELVQEGLVVARGHNGEIFEVSNRGYQIADMIEL
ncbi:DUF4062 domain-containing protein [Janthinobacterium sp. FW305-128]|uniref:DUF4062 domain-containing protein n=1 Tax=Janthinobacterium sp. FW305-128 TaxID=2775055 RepID=UPI001E5ADE3A|nr:DUF4062 domain-containing protein [Janthinobacterium sp. FW305-128]MCC7681084.1 DUF4062 domain-containing protein [Janthinobacterium sp. FW305-128]